CPCRPNRSSCRNPGSMRFPTIAPCRRCLCPAEARLRHPAPAMRPVRPAWRWRMVWSSANLPLSFNGAVRDRVPTAKREQAKQQRDVAMRKLIAFDDDTAAKLKQLARDRMATFQELADEAFADLLKKHGFPIDLKDALKKSARAAGASSKVIPLEKPAKKR